MLYFGVGCENNDYQSSSIYSDNNDTIALFDMLKYNRSNDEHNSYRNELRVMTGAMISRGATACNK